MLENLEKLVREQTQGYVKGNEAIPNDKNDAVVDAASNSFIDVFKNKIASGDIQGLLGSFQQSGSSETTDEVSNKFVDKLKGLGIDLTTAKSIAAAIIPLIITKLSTKNADSDGSFNIQDIIGQLPGADGKGQLSDIGNLLKKEGTDDGQKRDKTDDGGIIGKIKGLF